MRNMKTHMLALAAVVAVGFAGIAYAGGNELMYNSVPQLGTLSGSSVTTGDYDVVYDASADAMKKVDATARTVATLGTTTLSIGGTAVTATAAELNQVADLSANFEVVAATNVLTTAECGKTMTLAHATEFTSTLPAPLSGCKFKFIVGLAPSGASYVIASNGGADVITLEVNELETDTGDDGPYDDNADTVNFVDGVAVKGDWLECVSDGTDWFCNGTTNADGGVTSSTT